MASRHEIVTIDFRANAAKANPAMESLRSSAYDLRQEIEKTKTAIDEGLKTNMPQAELDKLGERLEVQTKKLRSFDQAMATLSKGVGTLSRAIDAFNTGTLDNMSAAFQKASYNAAEVAKKSLRPDSKTYQKDMAELDALQQKNLENLAKYKLRTEQLLNSIDTGGKISSQDLKQEGDALRELMQILPHMGREWLEYNQLLTRVTDATKQQADAEKRLKGAIVDVNDARQRATQLNREGVEAAARQHKEAQEEVTLREKTIEILEKERDAKQKQVSETAALAIAKDKEVEKERKNIAAIQERIDNEERDAKKTQTRVENLNKEAETLDKNAKISRESAESMKTDLQGVQDELVKVNEELTKMGTNTQTTPSNPTTEAIKTGAHEASLEVAELDRRLKKLAETKAEKQKIIDDYEAKYGKTDDEQYEAQQKITKDAQQKDFAAQDEAINKIEQKWKAYWEKQEKSAKQFAESIGKTLEELGLDDVTKHLEGPMADKAKSAYRVVAHKDYDLGEALSREGELTKFKNDAQRYEGSDSPEAKVIESLQRKYNDYIKSLKEAKQIETEYAPVHKALKEEHDTYIAAKGELVGLQKVENEWLQKRAALTNEDVQTTEKQTAAKKEEAKIEEQVVETQKEEKVTVKDLLEQNDKIKKEIAELNEEKKRLIEQQEKSAKATEAEANAFKDLTKEQAQARLEQKQQLATFKNEGGKWQITNREEAQKYLFDVMGDIDASYLGKTKIEGGAEQAAQLIAKFRERYGIQGDSDAMGAMRELMWGGGIIKQGAINKNFVAFEQDTKKYEANEKEIADLTQVIKGETKAVEENVDVKQRLEQVDAKILDLEQQSRNISLRTRMINEGRTEQIEEETEKNEHLNVSRKKSVELLKEMIEAYKGLSAEQASAEKKELTKKSTIGFKDGKLDISNLEEVQDYILRSAQSITGKKVRGSVTLKENQVDKMVEDFASRYGWSSDMANANKIFKQIIQGKEGLFKGGMASLSGAAKDRKITIQQDTEAVDKRSAKLSALTAIAEGAAKGIDKVTKATEGETDAIKIWGKEVERRHKRYEEMNSDLKKAKDHLDKLKAQKGNLPKTGADAQLLRDEKKEEIDKFTKETYNPLKRQTEVVKKSWESSLKDYMVMTGREVEETQQVTAAENQEAAATEKVTKGKKGKTKASQEAADATKEETKASQGATEQAGKQSAEEKKQEDLLKKKQELEEKQGKLIGDIAQKEEEAAGMETKAANKRAEATKAIEEQAGAHEKNNKDMGIAQENMKGLEEEQARLNGKLGEGRKEIAEYNKKIDENAEKSQQAQQKAAQSERLTIDVMTEAVKILEERNRAIEPEGKEWQENTRLIQQYKAELDRLKQQPVLQLMTERMGNIKNLSAEALQETKKFWQAMEAGAERGSRQLEVAAGNLRVIAEEERQRRMEIQKPMRENLNNLGRLSTNDLAETKKYWETVRDGAEAGSAAYKKAELAVKALNNEENRRKSNAQAQYIHDQMQDLNNLSVSGLAEVKKYWQAMYDGAKKGSDEMKDAEAALKRINAIESSRSEEQAGKIIGNMKNYSDTEISAAVKAFEQLRDAQAHGNDEWKKFNDLMQQGKQYLEDLSKTDALSKMEERMSNLPALSDAAFAETKKFFEEMKAGAEQGSDELKIAEDRLKEIIELERERSEEQAGKVIGDMGSYSDAEISAAVKAFEQLRDVQSHGSDEWKRFNEQAELGKQHLEELAKADTLAKMEENLKNLSTLSDAARIETKKFFETLKAGAEQGSEELKKAEAALKDIKDLENDKNQEKADIILKGTLSRYSESEIREAIEAAQAFRKEMESGSDEAKEYADAIARAEAHVKKYGVETARAKQQQKESDDRMQAQLTRIFNDMYSGIAMPSASQLKAQRQYWQRLIDDPKTAADSLAEYKRQLADVEKLENDLIKINGETALLWFQNGNDKNASENKIKEMADQLKEYRGTLLKETNADEISQIDAIFDRISGKAKKAAEALMDFEKARDLALQAGDDIYGEKNPAFLASPEEIQAATKSIEKYREELFKTIKQKRDMGQATEAEEEELKELAKYLKDLKFEQDNFNMSREKMEELMKTPTNAVNLDELRAAIKRADAELKRMEGSLGGNSEKFKDFAAQVKEAKNKLKEMEGQAKATTSVWEKAWSRLKTYVGMYMGFNMAWQRVTGAFDDLMTLSDKMGEVRKTTDLSAEAVGRLSDRLAKLDVRTPLEQLMEISAAAGQLGLKSEEDIMGFTEAANKMMIALPEMGKEAATQMMRVAIATGEVDRIKKQMEEGTIEGSSATAVAMEKIASTVDRLRASSASTAPEITDFVKRVGAVGAQSGISIDQVAALGSTISSLGMRVEMSATAISRMIPAIKNNAFAVANAIGVAPDALRSLFEAGRGMEAILMIFQHLKDQNMNADSIEKLLGIGGMQDVMKQLNQQGARAGIVFAGLSQNVDVLRQQLVTANQAYEKNMAITEEFNKMNDTTAAKWQRLKNEFEEAFVSDTAQRWLGGLIDGLKWVIDLLIGKSGLSSALFTIITLFGILKLEIISSIWKGFTFVLLKIIDLFKNWRVALELLIIKMKEMTLAQWGNVVLAVAAAVGMLIYKLQQLSERAAIVTNELAKAAEETLKQTAAVDKLFHAVAKTNVEYENAKEKLEGVKKAAGDTVEAENKLKKASADHAAAIRDINSKYGTYLGYMLSETASAQQLASARELINKKLRETITLKQQEAALGNVEQEYGGKVNKKASSVEKTLQTFFGSDYERSAKVSVAISEAAQTYAKDSKSFQAAVKNILTSNKIQAEVVDEYMGTFEGYRKSVEEYQKQEDLVNRRFEATNKANRKQTREAVNKDLNAILADYHDLLLRYQKAEGEEKKNLAAEVYKQQRSYINAVNNNADYLYDSNKSVINSNIKKMQFFEKELRHVSGEAIRTYDAMERAETKVTGLDLTNDGDSADNPWGGGHEGASTDWKNMTANQLVERRKQMNEFVKAIQTDSDVQTVLNEDAALKAAIEKGMSSDMRTVIDWYNTERLKIQDELHARYLTNTGDWMDPKKSRARKKRLQDDMRAYLEELDAYYTERKTKIQEAGNEEGVTEAEVRNRTLANEMEWRQRRAELQLMYSRKAKTITEDEQNAIAEIIASRTGDDMNFIRKTIAQTVKFSEAIRDANEQGAKEYRKFQGDLDLGSEKDYNKEQMALRQHLKAIQDIIDKERPFNGITKNLRENLVTMGVLTADMTKERDRLMKENADMTEFNARQAAEEVKRTVFMLGEAEHAYTTTIEQVMRRMADAGMQAWADELRKSPKMQEGMLAQLRQTYDEVQDAIKKEASLMKKQAENMWNSILLPGGDGKTTIKDAFEQTLSQLGIAQGRVSRANGLIGAGVASERVADKIAIKQMQLQLTMQEHYYNLMRKQGMQRIKDLERQIELAKQEGDIEKAKRLELDKQHADMSLRLATTKEQTELLKQQEEIIARTEESQNRLYTALREWADLLSSSLQGVFEATHAGDAEYYNERAKLDLTGKGGPGAGTYIIIDNEGTSDATAHYEYLDERAALERQREIEQQNAEAEAWKKLMDDLNMKMSEQITDWINASMQNKVVEDNTRELSKLESAIMKEQSKLEGNTTATKSNTETTKRTTEASVGALASNTQAIVGLTNAILGKESEAGTPGTQGHTAATSEAGGVTDSATNTGIEFAADKQANYQQAPVSTETAPAATPQMTLPESTGDLATDRLAYYEAVSEAARQASEAEIEASNATRDAVVENEQVKTRAVQDANIQKTETVTEGAKKEEKTTKETNRHELSSTETTFDKMIRSINTYGMAYQVMANDNLSASQKFQMFALQAAGEAAIGMLTTDLVMQQGKTQVELPGILGKAAQQLGPIAGPIAFSAMMALLGGLMGLAVSKVAKSKAQISQITGASMSAGRLSTGMMTYAEGNVNEFTDPATLTPGRSYNVDAADGRTYRAKYTGTNPRTHLTNGPEFHLAGEKGREMIIDAGTTREITMNETEIWHAIQTLRNGGHVSSRRGSRRGVRAFADGNIEDFETMDMTAAAGGLSPEMAEKFQTSIDRNNDLLERALTEGIKGVFNVYGKGGMVDTYDTAKKSLNSHGERY